MLSWGWTNEELLIELENTAICVRVFSQPPRGRKALQEESCVVSNAMGSLRFLSAFDDENLDGLSHHVGFGHVKF